MIDGIEIYPLEVKRDERGWLAELLRERQLQSEEKGFGQLYVTVAHPGKTKGKHFHRRKVEWFCVVSGEGLLRLKDTRNGEEQRVAMGDNNMVTVRIGPHVAHAITNIGPAPMFLVVRISEEFDPADPDTFPHEFADL